MGCGSHCFACGDQEDRRNYGGSHFFAWGDEGDRRNVDSLPALPADLTKKSTLLMETIDRVETLKTRKTPERMKTRGSVETLDLMKTMEAVEGDEGGS